MGEEIDIEKEIANAYHRMRMGAVNLRQNAIDKNYLAAKSAIEEINEAMQEIDELLTTQQ